MTQDFKQWWDAWWEEDYSWEGLAKKLWHGWCVLPGDDIITQDPSSWPEGDPRRKLRPAGARPATLQDYWREQKDALICSPDKSRRFTIVHLPLVWEDGSPTRPVDQTEVLSAKFAAAGEAETAGEFDIHGFPVGPDCRAQCVGTVLRDFNLATLVVTRTEENRIPVSISAPVCFFAGHASFVSAAFSPSSEFRSAAFSGSASFERASFSRTAQFDMATFSGIASFEDATFSGTTSFEDATFTGGASFDGTAFSEDVSFGCAVFSGSAGFRSAAFLGPTSFDNAAFSRDAWFYGAAFSRTPSFESAVFSGGAWFDGAAFFGSAAFAGAAFIRGAWFRSAAFSGDARFENVAFLGDASFERAAFSGEASFNSAVFASDVSFNGDGIVLNLPGISQSISLAPLTSEDGRLEGVLSTPAALAPLARRSFRTIYATGAVFLGEALFENRDVYEASSFDRAQFFKRASFHDSKLKQSTTFLDTAFEAGLSPMRQFVLGTRYDNSFLVPEWALRRLYAATVRSFDIKGEDPISYAAWWNYFDEKRAKDAADFRALPQKAPDNSSASSKGAYYAKLEDAFRTLKQAMEANRDRQGEARFFRLELLARRKKLDLPRQWGEWLLSGLYEAVSDFGNSVWRPLGWLVFGIIPAFAVLYAALATTSLKQPQFPTVEEVGASMSFSASRTLPLGPWAKPETCTLIGQLLDQRQEITCKAIEPVDQSRPKTYVAGTAFWVSVLATLQSAFALILAFLAALAARRRFQIN